MRSLPVVPVCFGPDWRHFPAVAPGRTGIVGDVSDCVAVIEESSGSDRVVTTASQLPCRPAVTPRAGPATQPLLPSKQHRHLPSVPRRHCLRLSLPPLILCIYGRGDRDPLLPSLLICIDGCSPFFVLGTGLITLVSGRIRIRL